LVQGSKEVPVASIYLIIVGLSAAGVFHQPARLALIPALVGQEQLVTANSFVMASTQIILAISYTIGGWLILALPLYQIALAVVLLLASAVLIAMLMVIPKRPDAKDAVRGESFWKSVVSGWRYLWHHPLARPLTVMETVEHLPHGIWTGALMLAFTVQALQGDASDWGYQITGYFAGMILGSLGALAVGDWLRRYPGRIIIVNAWAAGLLTLAFASSQTVWAAVVLAFIFGPPNAARDVAQDSLLQSTVEGRQLGRVYATRGMLTSAVFLFAGVFFAWLSEMVAIRLVYGAGGIMYLLTAIYAMSNRALRESRMSVGSGTVH
jgi:MFS family permease